MAYWQDRQTQAQAALMKKSASQIRKQMQKYYAAAAKSVIEDFESTYNHYLAALEEGREPSPADLYKLEKYWQMQGNLRQTLNKLGEKEIEAFTRVFEASFFETYYGLDLPIGSPIFNSVSHETALQMINSVWCADGKSWSDRVWDNKSKLAETLNEELINTLLTGKKTSDLKKRLQEQFTDATYYETERLINTELAHIQTAAATQRYKDSGVKEVQIWADYDERRCKLCGTLHKKKYGINEAIPIPAHPNCRCCVVPVIDGASEKTFNNICVDCGAAFETQNEAVRVCPSCKAKRKKQYNREVKK